MILDNPTVESEREMSCVLKCAIRIPSAVVDAFKNASDTSNLNALKEKVNTFNKKYEGALEVRPSQSEPETTSTPAEDSARTLCTPSFKDGDRPIDIEQTRMPSEVLSIEQFESRIELLDCRING